MVGLSPVVDLVEDASALNPATQVLASTRYKIGPFRNGDTFFECGRRLHPTNKRLIMIALSKDTPTVYLLDDDASVLKATRRLLDSVGWNVEAFTDPIAFLGHAAMRLPQRRRHRHSYAGYEWAGRAKALAESCAFDSNHCLNQQRRPSSSYDCDERRSLRLLYQRRGILIMIALSKDTPTVYLLDDDASVLKAMRRLLDSVGWNVEAFTDPIAFLGRAAVDSPSVAVIDIRMPDMNGLDVQKHLRRVGLALISRTVSKG